LNIRGKIKERLDELQGMMERQDHLSNPELLTEKIASIKKFWSALSEEERDFISAVRVAHESRKHWG
jgi:hypothetical protein